MVRRTRRVTPIYSITYEPSVTSDILRVLRGKTEISLFTLRYLYFGGIRKTADAVLGESTGYANRKVRRGYPQRARVFITACAVLPATRNGTPGVVPYKTWSIARH